MSRLLFSAFRESATPLPQVGALPVLLRTILVPRRMNPAQIIVVADAPIRSSAQQELMRTGRPPESVQWLEMNADAPLRDCLRLVAANVSSHRMVLIDGSAISQPLIATDLRRFCQSRDANGPATISHSSFVRP